MVEEEICIWAGDKDLGVIGIRVLDEVTQGMSVVQAEPWGLPYIKGLEGKEESAKNTEESGP